MNTHHKINYIEFQAESFEEVKHFYSTAFGWKFTDYGPEYTAFSDGTIDGGFAKGNGIFMGNPLVILYSDDVEASLVTVERCGGAVVEPIFSFPGGRRFHFSDPAGNVLAVWGK